MVDGQIIILPVPFEDNQPRHCLVLGSQMPAMSYELKLIRCCWTFFKSPAFMEKQRVYIVCTMVIFIN